MLLMLLPLKSEPSPSSSTLLPSFSILPCAYKMQQACNTELHFITCLFQSVATMARPLALLLCILFLLALVFSEDGVEDELKKKGAHNHKGSNGQGNLMPSQCSGECRRRCSRTQYRKPCVVFCNKCCAKCLCVPPGYYGNKQSCSCYNHWKTKRGGPKCP